jgi:UDP:flavonoid glycosyltransferase YjiC (YdhE family)
MARPLKILACMFQGGGNIPLILPILAELVARNHRVRVMVGPGVRQSRLMVSPSLLQRVGEMGAELVRFNEPDVHPFDDPISADRALIGSWTPTSFRSVQREARTPVWASAWALNVSDELHREKADLVVADFVLVGALVAAEAARIPSVALMHTVYPWPVAGVPPYGPGYAPMSGPLGFCRDVSSRAVVEYLWIRNAISPLNSARLLWGLPALRSPLQQYDAAARVLVLVSPAFDWPAPHLPTNVRHVGTPEDIVGPIEVGEGWLTDGNGPLVVVSLSTLNQGQSAILRKILVALSDLPVRALVTLGSALEAEQFEAPANVRLEKFVSHDVVLPYADALVTQCGIGTLTKSLRHGVPMVCRPLVGDQHDNAARVAARGAGIRLPADTEIQCIRSAIIRVLQDERFRQGALTLGKAISSERPPAQGAADEIEWAACSVANDGWQASP